MPKIHAILEGLLFLSGDEGISLSQLVMATEASECQIEEALKQLMEIYIEEDHGIELVCFGGCYKFVSKEMIYPYAEKLFTNTKISSLSSAALETLAIISYKQPITRAEVEEIRGVSCDVMIRKLLARSFIKECGRSDAPGKPFLYEITQEFMDAFQLESLKELPDLVDQQQNNEELFQEE